MEGDKKGCLLCCGCVCFMCLWAVLQQILNVGDFTTNSTAWNSLEVMAGAQSFSSQLLQRDRFRSRQTDLESSFNEQEVESEVEGKQVFSKFWRGTYARHLTPRGWIICYITELSKFVVCGGFPKPLCNALRQPCPADVHCWPRRCPPQPEPSEEEALLGPTESALGSPAAHH